MSGILRKALRDLVKRKLRSTLTLAGVVIGVAGLVAIVSTGRNLARAQAAAYANSSQADLTYFTWNAPASFQRALLALPNVAAADLRATFYTRWRVGEAWQDVYLVGIEDFRQVTVNRLALRSGRYPAADELLPEVSVRDIAGVEEGQEVTVCDRYGQTRFFKIVGFAQSPAYLSAALTRFPVVYAPAPLVRRLMGADGANQVLIKLRDFGAREQTQRQIEQLFARRGLPRSVPAVRDPANFVGKRELDSLLRVLVLFSALGLALSGFLVANTLGAIAAEQVSEIGVMKAIGATRRQALGAYLLLAGLYGVMGTALGLVVGAVGGWWLLVYIGRLGNVEIGFQVAPEGLALSALVGLGVTLVAGLPPAWAGTAIPVKEALAAYGITSTYGQGLVDRALVRLSRVPPAAAMALRNLARRKARNLVTLLVVALATAALLAALSTDASVNRAIGQVFATYDADAWAWFNEPVGQNFAGAIRAMPEVETVEAWSLVDGWIKHRRARVWGLPAETELYRPVLAAGHWLQPDEPEAIVVSADLAAERGIRVGDALELEIGDQARTLRVVGIVVDNSIFLGATIAGKVFAHAKVVDSMRGREGLADLFAVRLVDRSSAGVDQALAEMERRFRRFRPATESAYADLAAAQEPARLLTLALFAMVILVAAIGVIGVVNTLTLNVLERRREIGVMRAIGALDRHLAQAFLTEGLALGALGWLVGVVVGWPLSRLFVRVMSQVLFQLDHVVTATMIAASLAFVVLLVALGSVGPALGAARLPAAGALRYE